MTKHKSEQVCVKGWLKVPIHIVAVTEGPRTRALRITRRAVRPIDYFVTQINKKRKHKTKGSAEFSC